MYKVVNEKEHIDWINFQDSRSDLELTGPKIGNRGNVNRKISESFNDDGETIFTLEALQEIDKLKDNKAIGVDKASLVILKRLFLTSGS